MTVMSSDLSVGNSTLGVKSRHTKGGLGTLDLRQITNKKAISDIAVVHPREDENMHQEKGNPDRRIVFILFIKQKYWTKVINCIESHMYKEKEK